MKKSKKHKNPEKPAKKKKQADQGIRIDPSVQAAAKVKRNEGRWQGMHALALGMFKPALHPPGVQPAKSSSMAMDSNEFVSGTGNWGARSIDSSMLLEGQSFLGYPTLALMAQRTENRAIVSILATEMTRKGWRLISKGKDRNKSDKLAALSDRLRDLDVQGEFKACAEGDGFFGRGHLFLEFESGTWEDKEELQIDVGNGRDAASRYKVSKQNPLKSIKYIEAVWTYPIDYNTSNPLRPDWFKPTTWQVMGTTIHSSRLLRFVLNEVPDLLKPAYSFGGLSMTQMARPYVDYWLKTRSSIAELVRSFTVRVISTNLKTTLAAGSAAGLYDRAELLTDMESNNGVVMLDKDTEEFNQVSAPIGGLHELQAQSQEHMSLPGRIPTVKLSGISPTGLNASSDGELEAFDDTIASMQVALLRDNLRTVVGFVQLSMFDEVDDDIDIEFISLIEERPSNKAARRFQEMQTHAGYVEMGAVSNKEVRQVLAEDPDSLYPGLEDSEDGPDDPSNDPWMRLPEAFQDDDTAGRDPWSKLPEILLGERDNAETDAWAQLPAAFDAFKEGDHPRGQPENAGEWASGGGGGKSAKGKEKSDLVDRGKGALPAHIAKLKIPPAWTNVKYSPDPKAALQVTGMDGKGRRTAIYSAAHVNKAAQQKFARISDLERKFTMVYEQNEAARKSKDPVKKGAADCMMLIAAMGIRPGSEKDTGAAKQAYGATTLTGDHVVTDGKNMSLQFVGKKGVSLNLPVTDPNVAAMLSARKEAAGNGKLFGINEAQLLAHTHSLDGGKFKTKDFRTYLAARSAAEVIARMARPKNATEYKKQVMDVAKHVSTKLGNTPTVALQSYIPPQVFASWKIAA